MSKKASRQIKWVKFATRPTPLLERYLRMWGIVNAFKQFKSMDVNNILVISENEVDDLYVDKAEHNNLSKFAYQEFWRGRSRKLLSDLERAIENILEKFHDFQKSKISKSNFKKLFHNFIHYHGLGWAIVWYYHTCNRIFPVKIKKELMRQQWKFKLPLDLILVTLFVPTEVDSKLSAYYKISKREISRKQQFLKRLRPDVHTSQMIEHMAIISYLHEVADRLCSHYYEIFVKLAQKRTKLSLKVIGQYLPKELMQFVLSIKKLPKSSLENRRKLYVLKFQNGKTYLFFGDKAKQMIGQLHREEVGEVKILKGLAASPGHIKGRTVILKSMKDMHKVVKGDIIVSPMTTPRMLPAIRKGQAIVTDEGGITCHAAIVSRELKIPCIIGTKIATQVLKDGDLVEVDADKGVVKILKQ